MLNLSMGLYKMEMGIYPFKPSEFDLIPVILDAIQDLSQLRKSKMVTLDILYNGEVRKSTDQLILNGEQLLCYSVFINLLGNAIEASDENDVVLIKLVDKTGLKEISIVNSKPVPEEIRDSFFQKYVTQGKSGGTGLGTYIAKLMVEIQNGKIELESSHDDGTCITLKF